MKRLILWLAQITGVRNEIRNQQSASIAAMVQDQAYWLSARPEWLLIQKISERIRQHGYSWNPDHFRREWYQETTPAPRTHDPRAGAEAYRALIARLRESESEEDVALLGYLVRREARHQEVIARKNELLAGLAAFRKLIDNK